MHLDAPLLEMQHRHLAIAPRFTMHEQARTVAATEHHYEEVWRPQGQPALVSQRVVPRRQPDQSRVKTLAARPRWQQE